MGSRQEKKQISILIVVAINSKFGFVVSHFYFWTRLLNCKFIILILKFNYLTLGMGDHLREFMPNYINFKTWFHHFKIVNLINLALWNNLNVMVANGLFMIDNFTIINHWNLDDCTLSWN